MKWLGLVSALAGFTVACQNNDDPPRPTASGTPAAPAAPAAAPSAPATTRADEPYRKDVQNVCNVIELSGAAGHASNDRAYLVATWLGKNLTTSDAQRWLASIQRLNGNAKADALEQEARRVGLDSCALAAEWRSPPSR